MLLKRLPNFFPSLALLVGISLAVSSCFPEPDFADESEPSLTGFDDIYYKEVGAFDSLVIRVNFQDGDGDYGVYPGQSDPEYFPVLNSDGSFQYFDPTNPDQPRFSCRDYAFISNPNDTTNKQDTIRAEYNENYNNFVITLYTKRGNDPFQEVDFIAQCVPPLGGRFPSLKDDEDIGNGKPLEGVLQYRDGTVRFDAYRNDSLKIAVQIRDQAGHLSNILESPIFVLEDIIRGTEE